MRIKICLHGLNIKHQNQILGLVHNILPDCQSRYKVKEKYLANDDMYKYREARFNPKYVPGLSVDCGYGTMIVNDRVLPIADIMVSLENSDARAVNLAKSLIKKILTSKYDFVLAEPDFLMRIAMLRGQYYLDELDVYDKEKAGHLVYTHLPWQVYEINRRWQDVLSLKEEKLHIRQLRVKIRRLRSIFSLLKPLFVQEEFSVWERAWKTSFDGLAPVRELDVALLACERITKMDADKEEREVPLLEKILEEKKAEAERQYFGKLKINALTQEYADFLFWLYTTPLNNDVANINVKEFLLARFSKWSNKLLELTEKYPDTTDMVSLHRIRIKLKRFRYALQSVPELKKSTELLRALKNLQDSLGLLHDDFVDEELLQKLLAEYPGNKRLYYEVALFKGWDKGKASSALENFPGMWDAFCALLRNWQASNL